MGLMSNFNIPKIDIPKLDANILPSASDFGINTSEINGAINDISSRLDLKGALDLSKYPNLKEKASAAISAIPSFGNFSLASMIPDSFFDQIDTSRIQETLNSKLTGFDLGEFGTLKLPDNVGEMAKDIISGKGIDFMSLYSMPAMEVPSYNISSDFNLDELTTEVDQIQSIASNEFDVNEYMKEFSDISF